MAYATVGGVIAHVLRPLLLPIGDALAGRLAPLGWPLVDIVYGAIVAGVVIILSTMHTARWRHLLSMRYPSWMWAATMGCVLGEVFARIAGESRLPSNLGEVAPLLVPILGGAGAGLGFVSFWKSGASRTLTKPPTPIRRRRLQPKEKSKLSLAQLETWVSLPEGPVDVLHDDLFGHVTVAHRMARHLADVRSNRSIGLVGPYGCGKTSLLYAVERLISHNDSRQFVVAWVHSWGASSGTAAAELILRAVLSELSRYVDCLALADVPSTYRAALDQSGWSVLSAALSLVPATPQAEATLKRMDRVLGASGLHLVIFLEDLDRNEFEGTRFSEVQALLNRLKQSTQHISFVLAIAEEARSQFDFAKLCDRYEIISTLAEADTRDIAKSFTFARLQQYPKDIIWLFNEDHQPLSPANVTEVAIPMAVTRLLRTPRILRTTLRIVLRAWPRLHGEVDILEFLAVTTIRVGAPSAFQFLMKEIRSLRGNPVLSDPKKYAEGLTTRWDEANEGEPPYLVSAGRDVISYLFPMWATGGTVTSHTPQTIRAGPHAGPQLIAYRDNIDYWQRMFAEEVDGLRDQHVARTVLRWKAKRSPSKLFKQLLNSGEFAERFEQLVSASRDPAHPLFLTESELYELAGSFHRNFLSSRGLAADLHKAPEGFYAVWGQLLNRNLGDRHVNWVLAEIDGSLDHSLRFALDIEYYWTDAKQNRGWQEPARRHIVQEVRTRTERMSGTWLATVLDPLYPWTLHHLVRHDYEYPIFEAEEWTWIVPHLVNLVESDMRFIPHAACLVSQDVDTGDRDERGRPIRERTWLLDREYLSALIPAPEGQRRFVAHLVKSREFPNLEEDLRRRLHHLQTDIEKFLAE